MLFRACLIAVLPAALLAQGTTFEKIQRAKQLYANFRVEEARPILVEIIAPGYLQPVSPTERVEAYKYLGASYALLGHADTARTFFTAALDFDPFTDLDPNEFSPSEIAAFNEATRGLFKVGVAPIQSQTIRPREDSTAYLFRVVTTSRGNLTITIMSQPDTMRAYEVLFQDSNDGPRPIPWKGILNSGEFAPEGTYMIRAMGSRGAGLPTVSSQLFRLEYHHEALEDTLPPFGAGQLLRDSIPASAPYMDLAKGVLAALSAGAVASLTLNNDVKGWEPHVASASLAGLVAGGWSFLYRRQNRTIRANAEENARRQARRAEFNRGVYERNGQRLAERWLIITPVAGFSR